jgi:hypothetical protein
MLDTNDECQRTKKNRELREMREIMRKCSPRGASSLVVLRSHAVPRQKQVGILNLFRKKKQATKTQKNTQHKSGYDRLS